MARLGLYLKENTKTKLREKAEALGMGGRGQYGRYIDFIASNDVIVLDDNLRKFLGLMDFKSLFKTFTKILNKIEVNGK